MKNVNLTVDEETWRAARILAAKRDMSVSALVREALRTMTEGETDAESHEAVERRERQELVELFRKSDLVLGFRATRERTYER